MKLGVDYVQSPVQFLKQLTFLVLRSNCVFLGLDFRVQLIIANQRLLNVFLH